MLDNRTPHGPIAGRRQATWASNISASAMTAILRTEDEPFARGYTDHEQLIRTGFIHVNGRIYDPHLGGR